LQNYILRRAGEDGIIFRAHILEGYYGWVSQWEIPRARPEDDPGDDRENLPPRPISQGADLYYGGLSHQYFSKREIGEKRYRSVMAAISRATRRLEQRGLIQEWRWAWHCGIGLKLTAKGRDYLTVNSWARWESINQYGYGPKVVIDNNESHDTPQEANGAHQPAQMDAGERAAP
jgi:hypothetical protein